MSEDRGQDNAASRERLHARLDRALAPPRAVVQLVGPAGIGKSWAAREHAARHGAGHVVALTGCATLDALERQLTIALRDASRAPGTLSGLGERLVVLDDADELGDHLAHWLEVARREMDPQTRALITSRRRLPGVPTCAVPPLPHEEASALLLRHAPPSTASAAPATLRALMRLLDGNPLALTLAARRLRVTPLSALLAALSAREVADALHLQRALMEDAWSARTGAERRWLMGVSMFRHAFTLEDATQLTGEGDPALVEGLLDHSWLLADAPGPDTPRRFWLPPMEARHVRAALHEPAHDALRAEVTARHERLMAARLERWLREPAQDPRFGDALGDLFDATQRALGRVAQSDQGDATLDATLHAQTSAQVRAEQMCSALGALLQRFGMTTQLSTLTALASGGATREETPRAVVAMTARAEQLLEHHQPHAALEQLREASASTDPDALMLRLRIALATGRAHRRLRQPDGARHAYAQAAALAARAGDDPTLLRALTHEANAHRQHGALEDAARTIQLALNLLERAPALDPNGAVALRALLLGAEVALARGAFADALVLCERGLRCNALVGDPRADLVLRARLGRVALELGDAETAGRQLRRTLRQAPGSPHAALDLAQLALEHDTDDDPARLIERAVQEDARDEVVTRAAVLRVWTALESGAIDPALARQAAQRARAAGDVHHHALGMGLLAASLAIAHSHDGTPDEREEARESTSETLHHARVLAETCAPAPWLDATFLLLEAMISLRLDPAHETSHAHALWTDWNTRLDALDLEDDGPTPGGATAATTRLAARALARALRLRGALPAPVLTAEAPATPDSALRVAPDAAWFATPGAEPVALGRKRLLRRLLDALVIARAERPGVTLSIEAMILAGWPDEPNLQRSSALNRLHVALNRLRQLGLGDLLEFHEDGYRLDPSVALLITAS